MKQPNINTIKEEMLEQLEEYGDLHDDLCPCVNDNDPDECQCDMGGLKTLLSKAIDQTAHAVIESLKMDKKYRIRKTYSCPKCFVYYNEGDIYCSKCRTKIVVEEMEYEECEEESYNEAIDELNTKLSLLEQQLK